MKKQTWIVFLIFVCLTVFLVTAENVRFVSMEDHVYGEEFAYYTVNENLLDQFDIIEMRIALFVIFFFPFLLMIEATFFPKIRKGWWRILFLIQAIALSYGMLVVLLFMVFKLFKDIQELPLSILSCSICLGVLWNLLLIFQYEKFKLDSKKF
ncbi:MAG: hypothetical protein IPO32_15945 [Crocinitomicaceae bacterium]|nr:hypothetical protein [Crocinitomicaceae bacterium]